MEPEAWDRPQYTAGGDDAVVLYFVFGRWNRDLEISRSKYRSEGVPDGVDVVRHDRTQQPEEFDSLLTGYVVDSLRTEHPDLFEDVQKAPSMMRIQGHVPDPTTLDYLRNVIGFITAALDQGGAAVLDLLALRWFSPQAWRREIFDPAAPVPTHHVTILVSEDEGGGQWFHTRGMRKFGRPDISVRNVPPESAEAVVELCNRFIALMTFGAVIPEGQEIRMANLPSGMRCHHAGNHDDPDFNNVHIEINYPTSDRAEVRKGIWPWRKR